MENSGWPQIGITHLDSIDPELFSDFEALKADGLDLRVEPRPHPGAFAALEWLLPTAVVVYIGKSYFDSFLKEAGKDHYALFKAAISKIAAKFFTPDSPRVRLIFSPGKVKAAEPHYSLTYSIMADLGEGFTAKLLLQSEFNAELCNAAQDAFLQFLDELHQGTLQVESIRGLASAKPVGRTLLFAYDPNRKALEVVDPLPK